MAPQPGQWDEDTSSPTHGAAVAAPTGGATQDAEARAAIVAIIAILKSAGLMQQD